MVVYKDNNEHGGGAPVTANSRPRDSVTNNSGGGVWSGAHADSAVPVSAASDAMAARRSKSSRSGSVSSPRSHQGLKGLANGSVNNQTQLNHNHQSSQSSQNSQSSQKHHVSHVSHVSHASHASHGSSHYYNQDNSYIHRNNHHHSRDGGRGNAGASGRSSGDAFGLGGLYPCRGSGILSLLESEYLENEQSSEHMSDVFQELLNNKTISRALLSGADLSEYKNALDLELKRENQNLLDLIVGEQGTYNQLLEELSSWDEQLESLDEVFSDFRKTLSKLSGEIDSLQTESVQLQGELGRHEDVYQTLESFCEGLAIDNAFVQYFTKSSPLDEDYLHSLLTLEEKISFAEKYEMHANNILPLKEVLGQLQQMKSVACKKITKHLTDLLSKLRLSKRVEDVGFELMKYQYNYSFLSRHDYQSAKAIQQLYMDNMSKYYKDIFKNYISGLKSRVEKPEITKYHTIVEKKGLSLSGIRKSLHLGTNKIHLLDQPVSSFIAPGTALDKNEKISFESFFRSLNILLISFARRESVFCRDFFGEPESSQSLSSSVFIDDNASSSSSLSNTSKSTSRSKASQLMTGLGGSYSERQTLERIMKGVFEKSEQLIRDSLTQYLSSSFDVVGVLLIIRILEQLRSNMHTHQFSGLENFYDDIVMILWMRLKEIIGEHQLSLQNAPVDKIFANERDTHTVAKRYVAIVLSIYLISRDKESSDYQMLELTLEMLRRKFLGFIDAVVKRLSTPMERKVFYINTCDIILNEYISHGLDVADGHFFRDLLDTKLEEFVQSKLYESFGSLMDFVNVTEPKMVETNERRGMERNLQMVDSNLLETIVREFHSNWQSRVTHEQQEMQRQFKNLDTGIVIFKQYLTTLVRYYQRFLQIIGKCFRNPPFKAMMVSPQAIVHFIKQLG